jgi:hypothetical protein
MGGLGVPGKDKGMKAGSYPVITRGRLKKFVMEIKTND